MANFLFTLQQFGSIKKYINKNCSRAFLLKARYSRCRCIERMFPRIRPKKLFSGQLKEFRQSTLVAIPEIQYFLKSLLNCFWKLDIETSGLYTEIVFFLVQRHHSKNLHVFQLDCSFEPGTVLFCSGPRWMIEQQSPGNLAIIIWNSHIIFWQKFDVQATSPQWLFFSYISILSLALLLFLQNKFSRKSR